MPGAVPRQVTPAQLAELVIADAVHAQHHDDAGGVARCVSLLADELGGSAGRRRVDRILFACLERDVADAWRRGWQPVDVTRMVAREAGAGHLGLVTDAIAGQMRAYPSATVDRRWDEQIRSLDATVWWGSDEDYLEQWGRREGADRPTVITCVLEVLFLLDTLPEIPLLCPLPGTGRRRRSGDGPAVEPWILDNVRTLLAKAESTEFGEEAEALTAEAQEFMARRSIDAARLAPVAERALGHLSDLERSVVELVDIEGLSTVEAASTLGIRPASVRMRLTRARRRLRRDLDVAGEKTLSLALSQRGKSS